MINQNSYYPYQQNVEILKGFFSRPLTLICGILAGLSAILGMVNITTGSGNTSVSFSVQPTGSLAVLFAIALIFLYAKSRSNDPMPFGGMVTLIKIYSIIGIAATGFAILVMAGLSVFVRLFFDEVFMYYMAFVIMITPFALVTLLHSVAMLLWSNSIKRGATSVYLSSRGSILLAVTSILLAIIGIATTVAAAIYIRLYGAEISEFLHQLADKYPQFNFSNVFEGNSTMQSIFLSAATVIMLIGSVFSAIYYCLLASLAISFHIYIKKHTSGINLGAGQTAEYDAQQSAVSVPPVAPVTSEMPTEGIQPPVQQPIDFQPQSVDFGSMDATSDDEPNTTQFENPYMQAVADDMSDKSNTVVCPNCHVQCNADMKFCGNCGTKLK